MAKKKIVKKKVSKLKKQEEVKKAENKNLKKLQDKQLFWAIVFMGILLLLVLGVPYVIKNYFNKFVYIGLDFEKTQLGDTRFYSTRIPVVDNKGEVSGSYSINFRNDPRELEDIEFKVPGDIPTFNGKNVVYISTGKVTRQCSNGVAAVLTLSGVLGDFAGLNLSGGISDKQIAEENNFPYITCTNSPDNTVINLVEGNETKITSLNGKCYTLEYKDCEALDVSEKFIIEILRNYMTGFVRK